MSGEFERDGDARGVDKVRGDVYGVCVLDVLGVVEVYV